MNRTDIEVKLSRDRAWLLETLATMPPGQLDRPATPSEHDPATMWSMKDHFVHLALIEHNFNAMVRKFVSGDANPVGLRMKADGSERTTAEVMAMVHAMTEEWKRKHEGKPFDELVAVGQHARAETLQLLSELTDEQLAARLPGAPWADGTVGGVLAANADHGRMHYKWAKDGLGAEA